MNIDPHVLLPLRMISIALCSISIGMGLILLWIYIRHRRRSEMKAHVLCVAISFILAQLAGVGYMVDVLLRNLPFAWYASPLLLVSAIFGIIGLYRLMRSLSIRAAAAPSVIQAVATASEQVVTMAGKAVVAAEHVLAKAEDAVSEERNGQ